MFDQIIAITAMNLQNIAARRGTSSVVVVGIAGVVAVLVGLLAMAAGFSAALTTTAEPDRGVVLGHGSRNEMNSWLTNEEFNIVSQLEGVRVASDELYVVVDLTQKSTGEQAYVVGRGVTSAAFTVRPELRVTGGRIPEPGRSELLVGKTAAQEFAGLDVGDEIVLRDGSWTVVGHFETGGTSNESEIWMDLPLAQSAFRRDVASTARLLLTDENAVADVRAQIERDPRLNLSLVSEEDFYAAQSETRTGLIETFTYFIAGIMAVGAVVAALNSMYVAVGSRTVEIATLRALGFGRLPIVASVVFEALFLSLVGGALGAAVVYFAVDGYTTSTLNSASNSQVVFGFAVTPNLLAAGIVWALVLGFLGGLLPAVHAARLPITTALRGK